MHANRFIGSVGALRRKLRALTSVAEDAGATVSEKANAEALKQRLEERLREAGAFAGATRNGCRIERVPGSAHITGGCFASVPAARSHSRAIWNSVASAK